MSGQKTQKRWKKYININIYNRYKYKILKF